MNIYQRLHDNLVNSHRNLKESWKPGSLLERHRIVPAHQGGTYDDDNCTYLTRPEHVAVHWLLWKIHGHSGDKNAWTMMKGVKNYPSHLGCKHSDETRAKISKAAAARKRKPHSPEAQANMSAAATRRKKRKPFSAEARANMSASKMGHKHSPETRAKISAAQQNISPEIRAKISAAKTGQKHSAETRAKISATLRRINSK